MSLEQTSCLPSWVGPVDARRSRERVAHGAGTLVQTCESADYLEWRIPCDPTAEHR